MTTLKTNIEPIYQYTPEYGGLNCVLYTKPTPDEFEPQFNAGDGTAEDISKRIAMNMLNQQDFLLLFKARARECTDDFDKWRMDKTNNAIFEQTARLRLVGIAIEIYRHLTKKSVDDSVKDELIKWAEENKIIVINHIVGMQLYHRITNNTPADTQLQFMNPRRNGMSEYMFSFKIPGAKHPYLI